MRMIFTQVRGEILSRTRCFAQHVSYGDIRNNVEAAWHGIGTGQIQQNLDRICLLLRLRVHKRPSFAVQDTLTEPSC